MAWEWVSPMATTVMGVAAVGFAYLTGRKGEDARARESEGIRKHEIDLIVRRERLDAFGALLGSMDEYDHVIAKAGAAMDRYRMAHLPVDDPFPPETDTMVEGFGDLEKHLKIVRLLGSDSVRHACEVVRADALDSWHWVTDEDKNWRYLSRVLRDALIDAMRVDLGYSD